MNKAIRILSTLLIILGIMAVFYYIGNSQQKLGAEWLYHPSYYQGYFEKDRLWKIFLSAAVVIFFSILSCFFAWNKKAEKQEEVLQNAGYVDKEEITTWVEGSGFELSKAEEDKTEILSERGTDRTEILNRDASDRTELLTEQSETEHTELIENRGEIEQTELIDDQKEVEKTECISTPGQTEDCSEGGKQ